MSTTKQASGENDTIGRAAGWLLVAVLLVFEWALFRQFVIREVAWAHPTNSDQVAYLDRSYQIYERILSDGLLSGLEAGFQGRHPNGMMLPLQAAFLYLFTGPSRLSALTLNFAWFALLQIVLAGTLAWRTGRWRVAAFGVGLLLSASTSFYLAGGIADFRIDFAAFCLFGIFICAVVRSDVFASWRWSLVAGALAATLVLFRFLAAAYLAGILGLVGLFLCARLWARHADPVAHQAAVRRLRGMCMAAGVLIAIIGPILWSQRDPIWSYYVGHIENTENQVRQREFGFVSAADRLAYYPSSLFRDHAGPVLLGGLALGAAIALVSGGRPPSPSPSLDPVSFDFSALVFFIAACLLFPMVLLTLFPSPSPVVGGIMVTPLLWLGFLPLIRRADLQALHRRPSFLPRVVAGLAAAAVAAGCTIQLHQFTRRTYLSLYKAEAEEILGLYDLILDYSEDASWRQPVISYDYIADFLTARIANVLAYERHGAVLDARPGLGRRGIFAVPEAEAAALLRGSDFAVMTVTAPPESRAFSYPFNRKMEKIRDRLLPICDAALVPLRRFAMFGRTFVLYARPALGVQGASGGWITSDGLALVGFSDVLRARPRVLLRGTFDPAALHPFPGVSARLLLPGRAPVPVPTRTAVSGARYELTLDVDPEAIPPASQARIELRFDGYFVPAELGVNADTRRLVIPVPSDVVLEARASGPSPR